MVTRSKALCLLCSLQLYDSQRRPTGVVDAWDASRSNWMRFVNCSRHSLEQNLLAFQYQGEIYYRTMRIIPRHSELLVYYGSEFAHRLGVDVRRYNAPHAASGKDLHTYIHMLMTVIPEGVVRGDS
ncbi:hypothetical protein JYU34_000972 [Plutella xylostella]|uniref:SET domain-containing protein n=1 Tax=Plutella xylostella TaxID=51655 RepID=A0ABQ7R5R9_PLUXY|nr:hypothetical protein JYU34_000972 [Plutella xylostella]